MDALPETITSHTVTRQILYGPDGPLDPPESETITTDSLCSVAIESRAKGPPGITVKTYAPTEREAGDRALKEFERLTNYFAQKGGA